MTSSKRLRSSSEESNDRAGKAAKSIVEQADVEQSHDAAARIADLEGQVKDLHEFLWAQGLARSQL